MTNYEDFMRFAEYQYFKVAGESDNYRLELGDLLNYSTTRSILGPNRDQMFSTFDRDNDASKNSCANGKVRKGSARIRGGWWYGACSKVFPTLQIGDKDDIWLPYMAAWKVFQKILKVR